MTHDPCCPRIQHALEHWVSDCFSNPECDEITCQCDLIATVGADEREQAVQRVKDFQTAVLSGLSFYPMGDYTDGLIEKAIRGEQP